MTAGMAKLKALPAWIGQGILNWSGKVRSMTLVAKKYCYNVLIFFLGTAKVQLCPICKQSSIFGLAFV